MLYAVVACFFLSFNEIISICGGFPFCTDRGGCYSPEDFVFRRIFNNSTPFPSIGLGTAGLRGETKDIVCKSVKDYGYKLIDTAQAAEWYDERGVGNALLECLSDSLDSIIVVTKIHPRSYRYSLSN